MESIACIFALRDRQDTDTTDKEIMKVTFNVSDALTRAVGSYRGGHFDETETLCRAILRVEAAHFDAVHLLAVVQSGLGRLQQALASFDKGLAVKPAHAGAPDNRRKLLRGLKA